MNLKPSMVFSVSAGSVVFSAVWYGAIHLPPGDPDPMQVALTFVPQALAGTVLAVIAAAGDRRTERIETAAAELAAVRRGRVETAPQRQAVTAR